MSHKIIPAAMIIALLAASSTVSIYAAETCQTPASKFIEGSYIIAFKDPLGTEQPLVKGKSKEELAELLGTNGKISAIFQTINAIHIFMDAKEAERLSHHSLVLYIEQDMIMTIPIPAQPSPSLPPCYKEEGLLNIPRIDTADQVGKYQDARFQLTEQGTWELLDVKVTGDDVTLIQQIDSVDVFITKDLPQQVFLMVNGQFINACKGMGQINQRLEDRLFEVVINSLDINQQGETCTAAASPFEQLIPLSVYGLQSGVYTYNVNGTSGSFELLKDNKLPL
ncbi:MAG: hypothetical protein GQ583_11445 [Methyloprofundus sp.]|nr:hypothetical protein [Methyloprofundus sp.]